MSATGRLVDGHGSPVPFGVEALRGLSRWLACLGLLSLASAGCGAEPEPPAEVLRRLFPEQAGHVLEAPDGFELGADSFLRSRLTEPVIGGLDIVLPRDARGAIRLRLPDGLEIQIREVGLEGDGRLAERAVAYRRTGGTSFWTAAPGGFEEWLHLEAGVARAEEAAVTWEIEGANLRKSGAVVLVVDTTGAPRLQITAPKAYLSGGREVEARLDVRQNHLDLFVDAAGEAVLIDPEWTVTSGAMLEGRHLHTATLLGNGKVLVTGGDSLIGVQNTAELYDPALDTWSVAGMSPMSLPRELHAAAILDNGKVLVTGGDDAFTTADTAELYDPATAQWTGAGTMNAARANHTATLLMNGKVLVVGGTDDFGYITTSQLYDPSTGWSAPMPLFNNVPRAYHTATRLPNGKVLVAGGATNGGGAVKTADLYDPATDTWSATGQMAGDRYFHAAALLPNGKVLVTGGAVGGTPVTTAELYDPAGMGTWSTVPSLPSPRRSHTATLLGNGFVLVAGGSTGATETGSALLFDPAASTWTPTVSLQNARTGHTATLLQNGAVLVAGGNSAGNYIAVSELYTVDSNGAACAGPATCASALCVDGVCCNAACNGTCQACDLPGSLGVCTNIPAIQDPDNECTGNGGTDVCNGAGACGEINGTSCLAGAECVSGLCADGVCCDSTCAGTCQACNQAGSAGTCSPIPAGQDPANECPGSITCSGAGTCNNLLPDGAICMVGVECVSGNCIDGVCCNAACGGICQACNVAGSVGICTNIPAGQDLNSECTGNGGTDVCNGAGACGEINGTLCVAGTECVSGLCADGVCCDSGCGGICQACNQAGSAGTCSPIPAGQDPANECPGSITCSGAGTCNNLLPDGAICMVGVECVSGNCIDGVCCNAACGGPCQACNLAGSAGACTNIPAGQDPGDECPGASACTGAGACDVLFPDGAPCVSAAACLSGQCADGVCCNSACNAGPCDACSVAAGAVTDGTCALLTGTPCNDGDACTQTDMCQAGLCTGANPKTCPPMNACQDAGTCDPVSGTCIVANKSDGTICTDSSVCTQGDSCQSGACVPGPPAMCTPSDLCHVAGVCDPVSGCSDPVKPLDCSAKGPCELDGACNPATGLCNNPPKPNGTLCPGGFCGAGACLADSDGDKVEDAIDKCPTTIDPDQNDQDGDGLGDLCDSDLDGDGISNAEDNCPTIANPDQDDTNKDQVGDACECAPPKTAGSPCDDGNLCTLNDTCNNAGACVPGPALMCPLAGQTLDVCQVSVCFISVGACSVLDKSDGAPCPGGTCIAGGCYVNSPPGTGGSGGTTSGGGAGTGGTAGTGGGGDTTSSSTGSGTGGSTGTGTTDGAGGGPAGGSAATSSGGTGGGGNGELRLHGGCNVSQAPESAPFWWLLVSLPMLRRRRMSSRRCERKEEE